MLCQHCQKRVASVHYTQVVNNKKAEMYLCEQCASEKGQLNVGAPLSINDFISGLMGIEYPGQYMKSPVQQQAACSKCGMSYDEFQRTGKLGCSSCYELFGEKLKPLFKRLHGTVEHNGKIPEKVYANIKSSEEVNKLKELLSKAIESEEYEKAAELRDKIRAFENSKP